MSAISAMPQSRLQPGVLNISLRVTNGRKTHMKKWKCLSLFIKPGSERVKVGEVKSEINETLLRQEAARHLVATGRKVTGDLQDKGAGDPNP